MARYPVCISGLYMHRHLCPHTTYTHTYTMHIHTHTKEKGWFINVHHGLGLPIKLHLASVVMWCQCTHPVSCSRICGYSWGFYNHKYLHISYSFLVSWGKALDSLEHALLTRQTSNSQDLPTLPPSARIKGTPPPLPHCILTFQWELHVWCGSMLSVMSWSSSHLKKCSSVPAVKLSGDAAIGDFLEQVSGTYFQSGKEAF